jgi:hypothetical protein
MARCPTCSQGINSTYIRVGEKSLLKKVGFYCSECNIHYDLEQKPYTNSEKSYTVNKREKPDSPSFLQNKGALAGIWTRDLCLTKATLYQAELPRHHNQGFNMIIGFH